MAVRTDKKSFGKAVLAETEPLKGSKSALKGPFGPPLQCEEEEEGVPEIYGLVKWRRKEAAAATNQICPNVPIFIGKYSLIF